LTPFSLPLWSLLEAASVEQAQAPAIIFARRRLSYAALRQQSLAYAAGLHQLGIQRGDCVAIWMNNSPMWVALVFACARIGAAVMAVNTRFRSAELGDILARSGARLLVYEPRFRNIDYTQILQSVEPACLRDLRHVVAAGAVADVPYAVCGLRVLPAASLSRPDANAPESGTADDGCVMFTTSGTTSKPKLVLHLQRSIAAHAHDTAQALGYTAAGSVIEVVTPLCGVSGFGMPFAAIAARAPCGLSPAFDESQVIDSIDKDRVTHIHANHQIIRRLLDALNDGADISSLRAINCGSGMAGLIARADARGMPLQSIYGSSELQARFSCQRMDIAPERRLEAGGFPLSPQATVRVTDIDTGRVLPHGEKGEIEVCAPSHMHAYFGDAAATSRAITADGFVRTGDCGFTRADGSFVFEARIGDVLKLSGFMVSPAEIEALIGGMPGITLCSVVGVQSERGQRAVAYVGMAQGAVFDEAALIAQCKARIAHYKVPARIIRLDEFPMTAGANAPKVQKAKLRDRAAVLSLE
jgi:fatty-acyl-CoA synthase